MKTRLDKELVNRGLAATRSQAENLIRLGKVEVDGQVITKTGHFVSKTSKIKVTQAESYVSRAGLKLASANQKFKIDFKNKLILDVGSSTGGFTDYALQHGAKKVIAVDVGTDQLHPTLRQNPAIELHEKTDIRDFKPKSSPDVILIDVSFISLRQILPYIAGISSPKPSIIALFKPQFEAKREQINRGVIKNDRLRRQLLKDFENWVKNLFKIVDKTDSEIAGAKGNQERFYLLKPLFRR